MPPRRLSLISLLTALLWLGSAAGGSAAALLGAHAATGPTFDVPARSAPRTPSLPSVDAVLDVCLDYEPTTLYLYGNPLLATAYVLSAVYDGPIDNRTYAYQPVILERIPTLENGDAVLELVNVQAGDTVVNNADQVVTLSAGQVVRPSGCQAAGCAITYTAGLLGMDSLQVTATLQSGLTWSDGISLTASDSVYAFNVAADPDTPNAWTVNKYGIERTAVYLSATVTQTVWTGRPGFTPANYFTYFWSPFPEHAWGSLTAAELLTATLSHRTPLGWGAYVIDEWIAGDHISLSPNPYYHRAAEGRPEFDALIFHFPPDPLNGLLTGACDVLPSTTADLASLQAYDDQGLLKLRVVASANWEHLDFGIQSAAAYSGFAALTDAFQDVRVRRAFAHCLDRQAISNAITLGLGPIPNTYLPETHPYYPSDAAVYAFNPTQGRALLAEAGWVDTDDDDVRDKDGVEFSVYLTTTDSPARQTVAGLIAAQMLANCGVEVIPQPGTFGEVLAPPWPAGPIFGRQFDLAEFAWVSGSQPPCELYQSASIPTDALPAGRNNTGYASAAFDTACANALSSVYAGDALAQHQEAARLFSEDLPVVPLYAVLNVSAVAPHITEFELDATEFRFWLVEDVRLGETESIPPTGGLLASPDDATVYSFAAGTFSSAVTVTHMALSPVELPALGGLSGIGHYFETNALDGNGDPAPPGQPYSVMVAYTAGELGLAVEHTLALYYWDGAAWVPEPTSQVDQYDNLLHAAPSQFSIWAILAEAYTRVFLPLIANE